MMKTATTECTVETGQDIQKLFLENERGFHLLFTAVPISKFNLGGELLF